MKQPCLSVGKARVTSTTDVALAEPLGQPCLSVGKARVTSITDVALAEPLGPKKSLRPEYKTARGSGTSRSHPKFDVCEVFSPPRICPYANTHGLRGGMVH